MEVGVGGGERLHFNQQTITQSMVSICLLANQSYASEWIGWITFRGQT